jgi:hypothetical protein
LIISDNVRINRYRSYRSAFTRYTAKNYDKTFP